MKFLPVIALFSTALCLGAAAPEPAPEAVPAKAPQLSGMATPGTVSEAQLPKPVKISAEDYRALIAPFEGVWKGEIRPNATEQSGATYAERSAIAGRVIPAEVTYEIKVDKRGAWELHGKTEFGVDNRKISVEGRTYLDDGILRSISTLNGKAAKYVGMVEKGKIIWTPEAPDGPAQRSSEWVESTAAGEGLRTQSVEVFQGREGPIYVQLDGYFYKTNPTKPSRVESFERSSSLLN